MKHIRFSGELLIVKSACFAELFRGLIKACLSPCSNQICNPASAAANWKFNLISIQRRTHLSLADVTSFCFEVEAFLSS